MMNDGAVKMQTIGRDLIHLQNVAITWGTAAV